METNRKTAVIVGILFIFATTFYMLGQSIYDPVFSSPDYLKNAHPNRLRVMVGVLVEMIGVFSIILIPAFLFSRLRQHNEGMAMGYAGFRFVEAAFLLIAIVGTLSQVNISQDFMANDLADAAQYSILWDGVQGLIDWSFMMSVSFLFPVGALLFYSLAYQVKLMPNFLSIWGFLAAAFLLIGSILIFLDVLAGVPSMVQELIFASPIAVQEIVMAIWFIAKGFHSSSKNRTV